MAINVNFDPQKGIVETQAAQGATGTLSIAGTETVAASSGVFVPELQFEQAVDGSNAPTVISWTKVGTIVNLRGTLAVNTTSSSSAVYFSIPAGLQPGDVELGYGMVMVLSQPSGSNVTLAQVAWGDLGFGPIVYVGSIEVGSGFTVLHNLDITYTTLSSSAYL